MVHRLLLLSVSLGLLLVAGPARGDDAKDVAKKLEGTWVVESVTLNGQETFPRKGAQVVFAGNKMTTTPAEGKERAETFKLDTSKKPYAMDFGFVGERPKGAVPPKAIFELDGDTLRLCTHPKQPTEFSDKGQRLWVLKRKK